MHPFYKFAICLFIAAGATLASVRADATTGAGIPAQLAGYDLSEHTHLSSLVENDFSTYITDHFVLVYEGNGSFASYSARFAESTHARFYETFETFGVHPLSCRLFWACFSRHETYMRYSRQADMADMSLLDGYYSARTNRVAFVWPSETPFANAKPTLASATSSPSDTMYALPMDAPRTTQDPVVDIPRVQHEAAHQLAFNSGLLTRGVMYPVWVSEGLAVNFEYGGMADCVAGGNNEDRRCHLSHALCSGSLVPLDEFVTQARVNYAHDDTTVVYAQSWAFFNFLYKERPEELKKYLKMIGQLPRGRRSGETMRREFETAFGPVSQMRTAWDSFVSRVAAGHLK